MPIAATAQYLNDGGCNSEVLFVVLASLALLVPTGYYLRESDYQGGKKMKSDTEYLWFKTEQRREFINITAEIERLVERSGINEGFVLASAMHITAGVYINDAEEGLIADIEDWLEQLAPYRASYRHHATGETNADAHLKSLLVHHEVILPVTQGKLDLGAMAAGLLCGVRWPAPKEGYY